MIGALDDEDRSSSVVMASSGSDSWVDMMETIETRRSQSRLQLHILNPA